MAFQTIIQGAPVKEIISNIRKDSPTDEEIDYEKPMYFDVILEDTDKRLFFKVEMLTEYKYTIFLKNYMIIKDKIEKTLNEMEDKAKDDEKLQEANITGADILDGVKEFKSTFCTLLAEFCECINPELLLDSRITVIKNVIYKDEISDEHYFYLFRELVNINHPIVESYLKYKKLVDKNDKKQIKVDINKLQKELSHLSKRGLKNDTDRIRYKKILKDIDIKSSNLKGLKHYFKNNILDTFIKLNLSYLKELIDSIIKLKVIELFGRVTLEKLIPIFVKIIWYNDYVVKKKLQILNEMIMSRMDQQQHMTFTSEGNLVTVEIGDSQFPELRYSERSQSEDGITTS